MAGITELNSNKHTENESKNRLALASQAGIDKRIGRLRELATKHPVGIGGASAATKRKNIQVVVRSRPINAEEKNQGCNNVVQCDSVFKTVVMKQNTCLQRTFGPFDKVYGPEANQANIYGDIVAPLMKDVLSGYNCTIFAYGQTGSGKTYTMEGLHDVSNEFTWETDPTAGIVPRAVHHIFSEIDQTGLDATVSVSYVELYNEQIFDLLSLSETSQTDSLRLMEDRNKGVQIVGAEEMVVRKRDDVYTFLKRGSDKRRTAATFMNMTSSRSHSVFTVNVMVRDRETGTASGEELLRQGKLYLVDLAGSESIGRSGATDNRAREAGNINTSLLTLGRVITALTSNSIHVPYRESKLTRILQDSLGGNTITTIIATLSPASSNFEESSNTLEYAQRARDIKNSPEVNARIIRKGLMKQYNAELERLEKENCDGPSEPKRANFLEPLKQTHLNGPGDIESANAFTENMQTRHAKYLGFLETAQSNATIFQKKLKERLLIADLDKKMLSDTKQSLEEANNTINQQQKNILQLTREKNALQQRLYMYENAEKVADARSQQQRYIDQEVIAAAETDRRTLQTMAKLFENPVPTTKNVARLRAVFSGSTEQMNTVGNNDVAPFISVNRPPVHKSRLPLQRRAAEADDNRHRRVGFAPSNHRRSRSTGHSRHQQQNFQF